VHLVDFVKVRHVSLAPLGKELFPNQEDKVLDVFVVGQVNVLPWVKE